MDNLLWATKTPAFDPLRVDDSDETEDDSTDLTTDNSRKYWHILYRPFVQSKTSSRIP